MGMSAVAATAACSAAVALARIRSTSAATKELTIVEQVLESPAAFCTSKVTASPSSSVSASIKPWVAASSASWVTSWHTPTV